MHTQGKKNAIFVTDPHHRMSLDSEALLSTGLFLWQLQKQIK